MLPLSGCSYLFSDKRTSYTYKPDYGVDSAEFRRSLDVLGTEMVPHNSAMLLENGDGSFPAMLGAIRSARESINMELFIFNEGKIATEFATALADKAREGVDVRLLLDDFGSHPGSLSDLMEKAGVAVLAGTSFGPQGEGFVRLSYANSQANLRKAIDRIASVM